MSSSLLSLADDSSSSVMLRVAAGYAGASVASGGLAVTVGWRFECTSERSSSETFLFENCLLMASFTSSSRLRIVPGVWQSEPDFEGMAIS